MRTKTIILSVLLAAASFLNVNSSLAAEKKEKLNLKEKIETLVNQLNEGDYETRFNAIVKLERLAVEYPLEPEMKRLLAPVCRALDDFEANVRSHAAGVLCIIGDESALPALEKLRKAEQILWEKDNPLNPHQPHEAYIGVLGPVEQAIKNIQKKKVLFESLEKLSDTDKAKLLIEEVKKKNTLIPLAYLAKIPKAAVPEIVRVLEEYKENKVIRDGVTKHFDFRAKKEIISPSYRLQSEADRPYQDMRTYLFRTFIPFLGKYGDKRALPFLEWLLKDGSTSVNVQLFINEIKSRR